MPDVNLLKMFNSCFVSPQNFFSQKSYWLAVVFIFSLLNQEHSVEMKEMKAYSSLDAPLDSFVT